MNIEQSGRMPTEEEVRAVEKKVQTVIAEHQDIMEMGFSEEEARVASKLLANRLISSGKNVEGLDEDMIRRALEARRNVRGSGERMPVLDNTGMVIGTASSQEEAKEMARRENEARDLS